MIWGSILCGTVYRIDNRWNLTVFRDPVIEAVLQTLDVRFNICGVDDASDPC